MEELSKRSEDFSSCIDRAELVELMRRSNVKRKRAQEEEEGRNIRPADEASFQHWSAGGHRAHAAADKDDKEEDEDYEIGKELPTPPVDKMMLRVVRQLKGLRKEIAIGVQHSMRDAALARVQRGIEHLHSHHGRAHLVEPTSKSSVVSLMWPFMKEKLTTESEESTEVF